MPMNDTTRHKPAGSTPLVNPRHEQFAQAYAGEAHDNAAVVEHRWKTSGWNMTAPAQRVDRHRD